MKRKNSLPLICLLAFSLTSCDFSSFGRSSSKADIDRATYKLKDVKIYRDNVAFDKTIGIRFYDDTPSIPYIGVKAYFKEFFKTELNLSIKGSIYTYAHPFGGSIGFDAENGILYLRDMDAFESHPDLDFETSKYFLSFLDTSSSPSVEKIISLKDYGIDTHHDGNEIYAPLNLLSCFAGGSSLIHTAYNGEDIYVLDYYGSLTGEEREPKYFKNTYYSVLGDYSTKRHRDMIDYTYNQLCLMFDNDRGLTSQLVFGDTDLLSMGLNGLLDMRYPTIKEHLLSEDKATYYQGYLELFMGLYDGGHTVALECTDLENPYVNGNDYSAFLAAVNNAKLDPSLSDLATKFSNAYWGSWDTYTYESALEASFGEGTKDGGFYYHFDETYATSYVGFDSFDVDYKGWDDYYSGKSEEAPLDTYSFIRDSLYQALDDGATNFVFDITCNGGGDTAALIGIVGLLNDAKGYDTLTDILSKRRSTQTFGVDVNLDGVYDDLDKEEAAKFKNLNIAALTSMNCFSCGNAFPAALKDLGYKTIGAKTSGGSCAITYGCTADGLSYVRSGRYMIGAKKDGTNLDDGVIPDYDIALEQGNILGQGPLDYQDAAPYFYDVELISNYIESAYQDE